MNKTVALRGLLGLALAACMSQTVVANNDFTQEEANTIVKEDIASAQVMSEVCPAIIGKNAKFDSNISSLTKSYLADYSDKSMTLEKLQSDSEYKSVLEEARQAAKDTDKAEQKSVCEDVLNYEG
ncbi:hypothetical protein B9T33_02705 [Acinetobacter sp. ANC 5054]|uniref:MCR_0457 family protein n=1 Tax=Acinetobacter sp. ANC 5054 TaxID=1977877 RepID=UPI000A359285|nr:hypothetical protein [Acinetobacter sp. ANC 5054]OTG83335.1 hypothetical protein B9T33_02705 [Acinetobacter sp. ANC 5054]